MRIVDTITGILNAMVNDQGCALQSYQYNDKPTANVTLDRGKASPTALLVQVTDFTLDYNSLNVKEEAEIVISFLKKEDKLDAQADTQQTIVDEMAGLAVDFIQRLAKVKSLKIMNDELKIKSIFMKSDSNRTGVAFELTLAERQGVCVM